jgi:hypothetical protein
MSRSWVLTLTLSLLLTMSFAVAPSPARADAGQLCRSLTTVALAPTDVILAPYIVYGDMYIGYTDYSDHWLALTVGTPPGIVYLHGMQLGGALVRIVAGALEVVPGLVTLFRKDSPKSLFPSLDDAWSEYSADAGPCPIRIGAHWNSLNF